MKRANSSEALDEGHTIYLHQLEHHQDDRNALRRFLVQKKDEGTEAVANNLRLENQNHEEMGSEQFSEVIINHLHEEALAGILRGASERLPGANEEKLRKIVERMDISVDMRRMVA